MKQVSIVFIRWLMIALVLLSTSTATLAEPTSAELTEIGPQQSRPQQEHLRQSSRQTFLYWFKQCEQRQGPDALASCEQALKINPHVAAIWINHGQKLFDFGQYSKALISFENALLLKPDYSLGLANQCGILSALGQYNEALDSCEMALLGDHQWGASGPIIAWNNRGRTLVKMRRYEEALASFKKSLAIDPEDLAAQQYYQVVLQKLHQTSSERPNFPQIDPAEKRQQIALAMD